jgi:hypothetical protein
MGNKWVLLVVSAIGSGAFVGCGGSGKQTGQASGASLAERFVHVEVGSYGDNCRDCWQRLGVHKNGKLMLTDAEGTEEFSLSREQFAAVIDLVEDPLFSATLNGTEACPPVGAHSSLEISAEWSDIGPQSDSNASFCYGTRESPHPYNQLTWLLWDYKHSYLSCPELDPTEQWDPTQGPPVRWLCFSW